MRAQLIPLDGSPPVEIERDLTVVGRKDDCDLHIDHQSVSKLHCVLVKTDGLLLLRDLGSTNGTRVNGQRVRRAALLPNDVLNIASCKYKVFLGPDEAGESTHAAVAAKADAEDDEADSDLEMSVPIKPNDLPDVYPEGSP